MERNNMNQIFNTKLNKESINDDLISFADCPNKCISGFIINPYKHTKTLCPYCEEKRKQLISSVNLKENNKDTLDLLGLLNLKVSLNTSVDKLHLRGIEFNIKDIISDGSKANITDISYELVKQQATDLMNKAALGEKPDYSILFNFGMHASLMNFIYPLIIRYYLAGISITPFLTVVDVCILRNLSELNSEDTHLGITYNDLLNRDISIIYIDAGTTEVGFNSIKGLLSLRAMNNKSTIFVTSNYNKLQVQLEKPSYMEDCKYLATPYFIVYKDNSTDNNIVDQSTKAYDNSSFDNNNLLQKKINMKKEEERRRMETLVGI